MIAFRHHVESIPERSDLALKAYLHFVDQAGGWEVVGVCAIRAGWVVVLKKAITTIDPDPAPPRFATLAAEARKKPVARS